MRHLSTNLVAIAVLLLLSFWGYAADTGGSVYKQMPDDPEAVYFNPEDYGVREKNADVSDALQHAINQLKTERNFGIVFIPEGTYRISKTIYIPQAIRLIGFGAKRPVIILTKNSPGYQQEVVTDRGKANYMFWFTSRIVGDDGRVADAGAGTFYSAMSNINLMIEDGNPYAVALRTHFAQHSFISHVDVHTGKGKAGLFDVGNEMENVRFFGGDYGIYTTKTSPSWQMMMVDTYFEGQRRAAIRTQQVGLTVVRLQAKNVPVVIEVDSAYFEKLYMEDCLMDNITSAAVSFTNEHNAQNQITLRNVTCRNVPNLIFHRNRGEYVTVKDKIYRVNNFTHGLHLDDMQALPQMRTDVDIEPVATFPAALPKDYPSLPPVNEWVSVRELGAKGDGETDDTQAFQKAIANYTHIYVPQGWYVISETLVLKENTNLIGLNPISTQLILKESTPAFSGFGPPKPLLETPRGGINIVNGIGLNTGGYNYRAVGCKWMSGAQSYMNDVKFIGGHGTMNRPDPNQPSQQRPTGGSGRGQGGAVSSPSNPVTAQGLDLAWDNQYWSLWITNGGGGTFKDVWTANSYVASGIYVNNTSTEGRIYAMSIEHHVRNEATFKNVSNWKIYAFQQEAENREGQFCQPIELINCSNMLFANLYLFRVIWVSTPYHQAIRTWNCRDIEFLNLHNFTQNRYQYTVSLYDVNTDTRVYPWEITRLYITGKEKREAPLRLATGIPDKLAGGFEFAEGICSDSKGNVYFSEQRLRRIYRWTVETRCVELIADFPWEPLSLACDTKDNLLVVFKYKPQPGYLVNGVQESVPALPDASGTTFSAWGNSGWAVWAYSIDPDNPEESIQKLPKRPMGSVANVQKAIYPAHRWRDLKDFDLISVTPPADCFVAPDGVTIIPEVYDLARSTSVLEAIPGKPFYAVDEWDGRTVRMDVDNKGQLSNLTYFVESGEFGSAVDRDGNLYLGVGNILIYDKNGASKGYIKTPERPTALCFGDTNHNVLFFTSRGSLYNVRMTVSDESHLNASLIKNRQAVNELLNEFSRAIAAYSDYEEYIGPQGSPITIDEIVFYVDYLEKIKLLLTTAKDADTFGQMLIAAYPNLSGIAYIKELSKAFYPNEEQNQEKEAVRKLMNNYFESVSNVDRTLARKVWADDERVSLINAGGNFYGFESIFNDFIIRAFGGLASRYLRSASEIIHIYGDMATVTLYWLFDTTAQDGSIRQTSGRESLICYKINGEWKLVHVHYSGMPRSL